MADIFISYANEDREKVELIAKALEEQGWSLFWDFTIPVGKTWRQVITEALDAAKCAVVVWSNQSIVSDWVHEEAEEAQERRILVPIIIDKVKPPLGFRRIQAARLINWAGGSNHPEFIKLIKSIEAILGPPPFKVKEEEQKRIEAAQRTEERRKQIEAGKWQEHEEDRKRREAVRARMAKPGAKTQPKSPELHKPSNALKFILLAGTIVMLLTWIWWLYHQQQAKEVVLQNIVKLTLQVINFEAAVTEIDQLEQFQELYKKRETLSQTAEALSEQAIKVGLESKMKIPQTLLMQIQQQIKNREGQLIATRTLPDKQATKKEIEKSRVKAEPQNTIHRFPRTPLEKIELSQIKLIATIKTPKGYTALVEDNDGKGYIVKEGTYIGTNSGSVIKILKDRIIVEEEAKNALGQVNIKKRELTISEPP